MICLLGHGRNRLTPWSSKIGKRQRRAHAARLARWLDAWVLWMTGCCAARKAGGTDSL